jgi:hypothetical protein
LPAPVTVPVPVPVVARAREKVAGGTGLLVNVAVHVNGAAGIAKDAAHGDGDQPANVESGAGVAVSVTAALAT